MAGSRAYVQVHLEGMDACTFHLTGRGAAAFATVEVVGTDVAVFAVTVEQLDQLAAVVVQARAALAERQAIDEIPVPA